MRDYRPIANLIKTAWFGLPTCFLISCSAYAASFDCAKAQTRVEKLICEDPQISQLDEDMADAYANALKAVEVRASVRDEQKQWLKVRNSCKSSDCLYRVYEKRVPALLNDAQRLLRYQLVRTFPYEPLSELCQPYTDMLNAFDAKEPFMQCEQKLHPAYPQFKPIPMQELPSTDSFKYFNAIQDYQDRLTVEGGRKPHPNEYNNRQELFERDGGVSGYKYYLVTTDRFMKEKTMTFLIQEKQGDCRKDKLNPQRRGYEWDVEAEKVLTKRFSFQSMFIYDGEDLDWPGLFLSAWNSGLLNSKTSRRFDGIWVQQGFGDGLSARVCTIAVSNKR
jgi:uncharacterized protein